MTIRELIYANGNWDMRNTFISIYRGNSNKRTYMARAWELCDSDYWGNMKVSQFMNDSIRIKQEVNND